MRTALFFFRSDEEDGCRERAAAGAGDGDGEGAGASAAGDY